MLLIDLPPGLNIAITSSPGEKKNILGEHFAESRAAPQEKVQVTLQKQADTAGQRNCVGLAHANLCSRADFVE